MDIAGNRPCLWGGRRWSAGDDGAGVGVSVRERCAGGGMMALCLNTEHCPDHGLEEFDGCLGCASAAAVRRHRLQPCEGCKGVGFLPPAEAWEIGYWCPHCLGTGVQP